MKDDDDDDKDEDENDKQRQQPIISGSNTNKVSATSWDEANLYSGYNKYFWNATSGNPTTNLVD